MSDLREMRDYSVMDFVRLLDDLLTKELGVVTDQEMVEELIDDQYSEMDNILRYCFFNGISKDRTKAYLVNHLHERLTTRCDQCGKVYFVNGDCDCRESYIDGLTERWEEQERSEQLDKDWE